MPRKVKLKPGEHRVGSTFRKDKDKLYWATFCPCGWRGEETGNRTGSFDQFDDHMKRLKRGEEVITPSSTKESRWAS